MKKKLRLSKTNKKLAGVCGGIAEYFSVDATLIRILVIILAFATTFAPVIVAYVVCWAIMPRGAD